MAPKEKKNTSTFSKRTIQLDYMIICFTILVKFQKKHSLFVAGLGHFRRLEERSKINSS